MVDTSLYVTLSRQTAVRRELDMVANNLANLTTTGFRAERMLFDEAMKKAGAADPVSFVIDRASYTDHSAGAIVETSNQLDVAILGEGFFTVETPAGVRYTRDGRFVAAPSGELTALDGSPILDASGAPIVIEEDARRVDIAKDGTINIDGEERGQLGIVQFPDNTILDRDAAGRFTTDDLPIPVERPQVKQGAIEASNVDPIREITRLIELSRAYEQAAGFSSTVHDQKSDAVKRLGQTR